jgi:outer membrane lipoprotein-sorting protein
VTGSQKSVSHFVVPRPNLQRLAKKCLTLFWQVHVSAELPTRKWLETKFTTRSSRHPHRQRHPTPETKMSLFRKIIILTAVIATPLSAQNDDLTLVTAHLKAVTTMTAGFTQTDRAGKVLNGVLTLKRPGKIRFQYQQGIPLLIVGDGKALTFIDYSVKQVSRWPIGNSPLGVLLDPTKDLRRFAKIIPGGDNRVVLAEARDPRRPEYGVITLAFARDATAPSGLRLQGWVALDAQNNRTTVRLTNQQFNVPVGDKAFTWRDPRPTGPRK